jgi:serine/threonine protein kinase
MDMALEHTPRSADSEDAPAESIPIEWDAGMDQLGEYIIRRLVGEGGMGKVYEAEERLSKRRVALKVLRDELSRSEHARGLFLNEMQILAHLEHPNIVRSLASIETDGKLVTVLEFLDGKNLREVLNGRGRLSWEEAVHVVSCVAKALMAAHTQEPPVIHRDLKPENIMILDDGSVKVMDFGIAKLVQELNQTNTQSVGTLQYMSPEQIDAQPLDQRTDLYCLGLIFYELLTGHPPFQSSSPRTLLNMQCTEEPPPLEDEVRAGVAKGIQRLLFQLIEKEPDKRPADAADVVERLEDFLPERTFGDLTEPSTKLRATPSKRVSGSVSSANEHTPRTDTMPSVNETPLSGADAVRARRRDSGASKRASGSKKVVGRKDTIALIDDASGSRELSTGVSLTIIAVLMLLAGLTTYWWRASQNDSTDDGTPPAETQSTSDEDPKDKGAADGESSGW